LDFGTVLAVWYFGTVLAVWYFGTVLAVWYFRTVLAVWYFGTVLAVWYFGTVLAVWYFFVFHFLLELPRTCICVQIEQQLLFFSTVVIYNLTVFYSEKN
jgi:hypothetical protein